MKEQFEKYFGPIKIFWEKMSKKAKIILFSALGALITVALIIVIMLNSTSYSVLYSGMAQEEVNEVMALLQEMNVECKVEGGGTIMVPKEAESQVRMQLSVAGHPRTAPNYDLFKDNISITTTDFEKESYKIFMMNERLKACIETIDGVKSAIVTIGAGEESQWAWDKNKVEPTGSVVLELKPGISLSASQVDGIKRIVMTSIPGLKAENVSVVDSTGNELKSSSQMNYMDITKFKFEIEKEFEKDIYENVMEVLTPVVGKGNLSVSVKSTMNIDKSIKDITTYKPEESGKGVISEENTNKEQVVGGDEAGGVAGSETNADVPSYEGVTVDGDKIYVKDENTYKYLVSQITEQVSHEAANIENLSLAISINKEFMSDEETENIKKLVAHAASVKEDQVFVYATLFPDLQKNTPDVTQEDNILKNIFENKILFYSIIGGLVLIILIIIVLIIIISKKHKKAKKQDIDEIENSFNPLPEQDIITLQHLDIDNQAVTKEQVLKKEIKDFSASNPEIVAQLIRTWLKGEDD